MTADALTKVRSWAAPFMVSIICGMGLILWQNQQNIIDSLQDRIASMEIEVGNSRATLAVISENQSNSREDRQEFQQGVTARLDRMEQVHRQRGDDRQKQIDALRQDMNDLNTKIELILQSQKRIEEALETKR